MALSELQATVFADHLTRTFGVEPGPQVMGRDRNPVCVTTTVPVGPVAESPTGSQHIEAGKDRLIW